MQSPGIAGTGDGVKVFHLMSGAPYGGIERQAERLAAVLKQHGAEQRAMFTQDAARAKRFADNGIESMEMEYPSRFAFLDRRRINGVIQRFEPDIVVSWMPDVAALVQKENFLHVGRIAPGFDYDALHTKYDHLFTPAQSRADTAMNAGWSVQQVHVLPHLPSLVSGNAPIEPANRKTFYTPPTAKLIVTAMRLTKGCGLEVLLEAVSRLSGYYLWIAGDGADRAYLEQVAHDRGVKPRVRFLSWRDDLTPFLAAADVFVYPARQEDVADAVTEAWAAGAAVIASDSLGPGLLIRHKENGVLVPVGDAISMAEMIRSICQDPDLAKRLGDAGRKAYRETYAADKVAPQYVDLFDRLAAKPPAAPGN